MPNAYPESPITGKAPDVAVHIAKTGQARGLRVIDAPVSGGQAGAVEASLSIMVGGEAADFEIQELSGRSAGG